VAWAGVRSPPKPGRRDTLLESIRAVLGWDVSGISLVRQQTKEKPRDHLVVG